MWRMWGSGAYVMQYIHGRSTMLIYLIENYAGPVILGPGQLVYVKCVAVELWSVGCSFPLHMLHTHFSHMLISPTGHMHKESSQTDAWFWLSICLTEAEEVNLSLILLKIQVSNQHGPSSLNSCHTVKISPHIWLNLFKHSPWLFDNWSLFHFESSRAVI